jgi:signal transduction histidine kinase
VKTRQKIGLTILLLGAIALGLWGISLVWVRSDVPFKWENRGEEVVVIQSLAPAGLLMIGDVVLSIGPHFLRNGEEIEFALDGTRAGDRVSARWRRGEQEISATLTLRPRNTWRYAIVNLILGLFIVLIGVWVFFNKSREKPARIFLGLALSLGLAILISTARLPAGTKPWAYILPVVYWFIYPLFPAFFVHFVAIFPREKLVRRSRFVRRLLIYGPAVIFIILLQSRHLPALLGGNLEDFRAYYRLFNFHRFYIVFFFLAAMAALIHSYWTAQSGSEKDKVRWILWGLAMGCAPFIVLWSIPLAFGAAPLVPEEITSLALLIAPVSFAVAIVKYNFFDIDAVINRSLVYGFLSGGIIGVYLLLSGLAGHFMTTMSPETNRTVAVLCTLAAAALFNPAKQKIQNLIDRTFYRAKYNYRLTTKEFSQLMTSARTQSEALNALMSHIHAAVPLEKMAVLAAFQGQHEILAHHKIAEEDRALLISDSGKEMLQAALAQAAGVIIAGAAVPSAELDPNLERRHFEMLLPVAVSAGEWGALLLGRKLSGNKYSEEDVELFLALAAEAFGAITRIRFQEAAVQERAEREKLEALNRLKDEKNRELELKNAEIVRAQEKLVMQEKLASLGQLTAGIAHEIKNPLNFVNNFAALSVELAKELREEIVKIEDGGLKIVDGERLANMKEILETLEQNAEKINHHGKRADNIVKSMMQHARGSSGQRELTDINHLLDEAVNLVYHGMRANDASFNITIEKEYDESIGKLEVVPQDLSRVFLNIVNNASYAAFQKQKANAKEQTANFSPTISVATKSLSDGIEIRIRDNGNGIPPDIREKIFNPFFTTKPTGQGTGLGLSISYDIIVQQHRGEIKVETEEGKFTEFVVRLPRMA